MGLDRIAVLMSTYNGASYIREQLDSILAQKDVEVTLYVRDDGSSDQTVEIVKEYMTKAEVHLIVDGENLRPGASFMRLLHYVVKKQPAFEYYAFADQDDIWLEDKLHAAIEMLKTTNKPAIYASNQYIFRDGKNEGLRFTETPDLSLMGHININELYGCTMAMNRELAEAAANVKCPPKEYLDLRCHDSWVFLIACVIGKVFYDKNSYILYRIHSSNSVGIKKLSIIGRLKRMLKGTVKRIRSQAAKMLVEAFPQMTVPEKENLEKIAYYQKGLGRKIALIKIADKCKTAKESKLVFSLKVLFNYI